MIRIPKFSARRVGLGFNWRLRPFMVEAWLGPDQETLKVLVQELHAAAFFCYGEAELRYRQNRQPRCLRRWLRRRKATFAYGIFAPVGQAIGRSYRSYLPWRCWTLVALVHDNGVIAEVDLDQLVPEIAAARDLFTDVQQFEAEDRLLAAAVAAGRPRATARTRPSGLAG